MPKKVRLDIQISAICPRGIPSWDAARVGLSGYICFVSLRALISAASFPCLFERGHILLSRDRTGGVSFLFNNETSKKVNGFRSPFFDYF